MGVRASVGRGRRASEASEGEGCAGCGTEISGSPGWSLRPLAETASFHQSHHLSFFAPENKKKPKLLNPLVGRVPKNSTGGKKKKRTVQKAPPPSIPLSPLVVSDLPSMTRL